MQTTRNVIDLLTDDHTKVKGLFRQYESFDKDNPADNSWRVVEQAISELETHTILEEELVYPAFRQWLGEEGNQIDHNYEEHAQVKKLIADIRASGRSKGQYDATFRQIIKDVEHHASEEENDLFPRIEDLVDEEELTKLGAKVESRKGELKSGGIIAEAVA